MKLRVAFALALCLVASRFDPAPLRAQPPRISPSQLQVLLDRLEAQEARIQGLEGRLGRAAPEIRRLPPVDTVGAATPGDGQAWESAWDAALGDPATLCEECEATPFGEQASPYYVDYDRGFVIRPRDQEEHPFELQINGRSQFRHVALSPDIKTYTNREGTVRVTSRNFFDIERGRLKFSGFAFDPDLQYFINFDFDTDSNDAVVILDFWANYKFSDLFNVHAGKGKVPGSRDWLQSSARLQLVDRSMATTFFRPDRSSGIWSLGELAENLHYHAMICDGFFSAELNPGQLDDQFTYSGSMWWDPLGDYGPGYSDLAWHTTPVARVGHSFTYSPGTLMDSMGNSRSEVRLRLSDGSLISAADVLGPGATFLSGELYLYAIDAAVKYRGLSVNAEYYLRWLEDIRATGPTPFRRFFDKGFYVDAGAFLVAKKLEVVGRVSNVDGIFKDSWEYAAGFNWYVNETDSNKVSFDVSLLDGSPTSNTATNYRVGDSGALFRTQWQLMF